MRPIVRLKSRTIALRIGSSTGMATPTRIGSVRYNVTLTRVAVGPRVNSKGS